jgi:hypothetical protein
MITQSGLSSGKFLLAQGIPEIATSTELNIWTLAAQRVCCERVSLLWCECVRPMRTARVYRERGDCHMVSSSVRPTNESLLMFVLTPRCCLRDIAGSL